MCIEMPRSAQEARLTTKMRVTMAISTGSTVMPEDERPSLLKDEAT